MSNDVTAPSPTPNEENLGENSRMQQSDVSSPASRGQNSFHLQHRIRIIVLVTSVCLLIAGLLLIILGAIGTANGAFLQKLTGINAVVTGVTLSSTGAVGCLVFVLARTSNVGRWKLILLVVACHASGAFAIQCCIITGQMAVRIQPVSCETVTTSDELVTGSDPPGPPINTCVADTPTQTYAVVILILSILGFLLGVVCSASCYAAAPRLLCCICDMPHHQPAKSSQEAGTSAEVQPVLAGQAEQGQNQPTESVHTV